MAKKDKKQDDLDTETTFADMNVEGFRWYDPSRKKNGGKKTNRERISRREYWAMVRAAFVAYLPVFLIVTAVFGIVACIAWLWVG